MIKVEEDLSKLGFEEGMAELEKLVDRLEARDIGLEESIVAYERGHALQQHLAAILKKTEMRIEKIGQKKLSESRPEPEGAKYADTQDDSLPF